jgi:hypothetical protein
MTSILDITPKNLEEFAKEVGLTVSQIQKQQEIYAQAKARCVELLSSSPLHQARQARNPKYFENLRPFMGWPEVD